MQQLLRQNSVILRFYEKVRIPSQCHRYAVLGDKGMLPGSVLWGSIEARIQSFMNDLSKALFFSS